MRIITIVSSLICHILLFGASLTLKQGWNLVGLPGDGWISTSTLLERTPNISIVWGYNAPTQELRLKTRKSIDSPYASLDSIATGQGVWIKVDQDTSIDFDVGEASDLNLSTFWTGWHLFSTPNAIDTAKLGATHPQTTSSFGPIVMENGICGKKPRIRILRESHDLIASMLAKVFGSKFNNSL